MALTYEEGLHFLTMVWTQDTLDTPLWLLSFSLVNDLQYCSLDTGQQQWAVAPVSHTAMRENRVLYDVFIDVTLS
jgi:hypothetical protein